MWNCLLSQKFHAEELRIFKIYESLLSWPSVLIVPYSSLSLSDELHIFWDDETDTGNNDLLSISYDDLIMDIFVTMQ